MSTPAGNGRGPRGQRPSVPDDAPGAPIRSVRIVIADDQTLDRKGLRAILESQADFVVVDETASKSQTIESCREFQPDVLILHTQLSGGDGVTAIPDVLAASPETRVLAVAERGEGRCIVLNPPRIVVHAERDASRACSPGTDCLQLAVVAGAHGAIRRSATPEDFFRALRALAGGHAWFESGTAKRLLDQAHRQSDREVLSPREMEVAALIADGLCNKDIARTLDITTPTVKKHVGRILAKLGLEDRLQVGLHLTRNPLLLRRAGS